VPTFSIGSLKTNGLGCSLCPYCESQVRLRADALDERRDRPAPRGKQSACAGGEITQSERDWAFAKRALARGDDPEEVIRRIADYRADEKSDPDYYARHTVAKALEEFSVEKSFSNTATDSAIIQTQKSERSM
jgi:hypothetical protein